MQSARRAQRTIAREAVVRGIGFLSGADVTVVFKPAAAGMGIRFVRCDLPGQPDVPATVHHVIQRQRRTTIQQGPATVEMVEHVLAALAGLRIDNCTIEIDAPETPGCDGSSQAFVQALTEAGLAEQTLRREAVYIDRPIAVREGACALTAYPGCADELVLTYNLDYGPDTPIGRQSLFLEVSPDAFRRELAPSRTFLLEAEARAMLQAGLGQRLSPGDLLVFGPHGPIGNQLRYPDECVRHKLLDLVGDLGLLGRDIVGHIVAHRSGHQLNAELVRRLAQLIESNGSTRDSASREPALDTAGIMKVVPHRYPFLLIDRIVHLDRNRGVVAVKNVTINEPFFQGHWPHHPIMPGVLILEALAQTAGILIAQWVDPSNQLALIVGLDNVKIRRQVVPGDQLQLEVEGLRIKKTVAEVRALAKVGDQLVAEAQMRFAVVGAEGQKAA